MEKYNTIKIWAKTLPKLKLLSALSGTSIVKIIDTLVDKELKKTKGYKK